MTSTCTQYHQSVHVNLYHIPLSYVKPYIYVYLYIYVNVTSTAIILSLVTSDTTCNMYCLLYICHNCSNQFYIIIQCIQCICLYRLSHLYVSCICLYIYQHITCLKTRHFIIVKYLLVSVNFVVINLSFLKYLPIQFISSHNANFNHWI